MKRTPHSKEVQKVLPSEQLRKKFVTTDEDTCSLSVREVQATSDRQRNEKETACKEQRGGTTPTTLVDCVGCGAHAQCEQYCTTIRLLITCNTLFSG